MLKCQDLQRNEWLTRAITSAWLYIALARDILCCCPALKLIDWKLRGPISPECRQKMLTHFTASRHLRSHTKIIFTPHFLNNSWINENIRNRKNSLLTYSISNFCLVTQRENFQFGLKTASLNYTLISKKYNVEPNSLDIVNQGREQLKKAKDEQSK